MLMGGDGGSDDGGGGIASLQGGMPAAIILVIPLSFCLPQASEELDKDACGK